VNHFHINFVAISINESTWEKNLNPGNFNQLNNAGNDCNEEDSDGERSPSNNCKADSSCVASSNPENENDSTLKANSQRKSRKGKFKSRKAKGREIEELSIEEFTQFLSEVEFPNRENSLVPEHINLGKEAVFDLLAAESRFLDPEIELSRMFGAQVIQQERQEVDLARQGQRRRRREKQDPHRQRMYRSTISKYIQNWGDFDSYGMSMKLIVSNEEGDCDSLSKKYIFEHSSRFQAVQALFIRAVASLDPSAVSEILSIHPWHPDALLQMSKVHRVSGNAEVARDYLCKALFSLERSATSTFSWVSGTRCMLPYAAPTNRVAHLALFYRMLDVAHNACWRTALEFSKLLLGLDPLVDPLGVLLVADVYAIRSKELPWVIAMSKTDLCQSLPNWKFSSALAQFLLGNVEGATFALQECASQWPYFFVEVCGVSIPSYENLAILSPMEEVMKFYSKDLWREPRVSSWVKCIQNWPPPGQLQLRTIEDGVWRHIMVAELSTLERIVPLEIRSRNIYLFNPVPPNDSMYPDPYADVYSENGLIRDRESIAANTHPLAALLYSLAPWMNQVVDAGNEGQEQVSQAALQGILDQLPEQIRLRVTRLFNFGSENNDLSEQDPDTREDEE
jgi:hypothetical protein